MMKICTQTASTMKKKKFEQKRAFESLNNEIQTDYRKTKQRWVSKNLKNGTQNDYRKFKQKY